MGFARKVEVKRRRRLPTRLPKKWEKFVIGLGREYWFTGGRRLHRTRARLP
jgi:hypothetical protein